MLSNLWDRFNAKLDDTFGEDTVNYWCRGFVLGAYTGLIVRGTVKLVLKLRKH